MAPFVPVSVASGARAEAVATAEPAGVARGPLRRVLILDGYVDEPANFGVPPYVSPHARYLAGAARAADPGCEVRYLAIDEWRSLRGHGPLPDEGSVTARASKPHAAFLRAPDASKLSFLESADLTVVVAGALVPGKYVRGVPISLREARLALGASRGVGMIAGSTALYGFGRGGGLPPSGRADLDRVFAYRSRLHADALLFDLMTGASDGRRHQRKRSLAEWRDWAVRGAFIVREHPDWPEPLFAEIDTYHGCVRFVNGGCAFCMEPKEGRPVFRPVEDVVAEVAALAAHGVRSFRIGGQACFFSFHARGLGETPTPAPDPSAIEALLKGVRKAVPDLLTLHLDNVDPAVLAANPVESLEVAKLVVEHMTDGNVAAFGLESADPAVKEANNLNADADVVLAAAEILNRCGAGAGPNGFPAFLPGLNFLCGLPGERRETYDLNRAFLTEYVRRGLLARRINIRKVVVDGNEADVDPKTFLEFKRFVREEIDRPMLRRMFPPGRLLRRVFTEARDGKTTFGRPIGTYALLVGIPYEVPLGTWVDVCVTDHGYRSITGVAVPFDVNRAPLKALEALPGVGKKRAVRLAVKRPFRTPEDLRRALDDPQVAEGLVPLVSFGSPGSAA